MNEFNEYRVKPVIRYHLTHYHSKADGNGRGASGGVRSLGEFDSEDLANEAKAAYERADRTITHTRIVPAQEVRGPRGIYYHAGGRFVRAFDEGMLGLEMVMAIEYQDPHSPGDNGELFTLERPARGKVWAEIEVQLR